MIKTATVVILLMLLAFSPAAISRAATWGVARIAAPVLNSPDFSAVFGGKTGSLLKTDRCGLVRELEFIALPGTVFSIRREMKRGENIVYQVETEEYPAAPGVDLYIDSRFLELRSSRPPERKRSLPSRSEIAAALADAVGSPYVWGGNVRGGVPELSGYFYRNVSGSRQSALTLAGLDCSGLLYEATAGWTPRNTSQLVSYGKPVVIEGRNAEEIAGSLEPLDLIVWNGHVIIVLNRQTAVESRLECGAPGNGGVTVTPLSRRLEEIMRTRTPVNVWPLHGGKPGNIFVVRRWYGTL